MPSQLKQTVDYFPHFADASDHKTLTILQIKYGDTGYAFWFRLLECLASTNGHYIPCNTEAEQLYLTSRLRVGYEKAMDILKTLVELDAIDRQLWETQKVIWSDNFVQNISTVYANRRHGIAPTKPLFNTSTSSLQVSYAKGTVQTRRDESRVDESILYDDKNIIKQETPIIIDTQETILANKELKKHTLEENKKCKEVFAGLKRLRGYNSPKPSAEAVAIYKMLKEHTPEEILKTWEIMKADKFWQGKELFMNNVRNQINAILKGNNGSKPDGTYREHYQGDDGGANQTGNNKYTSGKYGGVVQQ